jgi:hypothetical protein
MHLWYTTPTASTENVAPPRIVEKIKALVTVLSLASKANPLFELCRRNHLALAIWPATPFVI